MSHPDRAKSFLPQERKESMEKLSWMSQKESRLVGEQDIQWVEVATDGHHIWYHSRGSEFWKSSCHLGLLSLGRRWHRARQTSAVSLSLASCYYSHFLFYQCLQATCTLLAAQACTLFGQCSWTKTHGILSFSYSVLYPIFSADLKMKVSILTSYPLKKLLKVCNINPSTRLVWSHVCVCMYVRRVITKITLWVPKRAFLKQIFLIFKKSSEKLWFWGKESGNKLKNNSDCSSLPVWCMKDRFQISGLLSALNPSKADSAFHASKVKRFSSV